jgi:hypothetical protein
MVHSPKGRKNDEIMKICSMRFEFIVFSQIVVPGAIVHQSLKAGLHGISP